MERDDFQNLAKQHFHWKITLLLGHFSPVKAPTCTVKAAAAGGNGCPSQAAVCCVAHLNLCEEFPEWNSFDFVLTVTWAGGFLAGKGA